MVPSLSKNLYLKLVNMLQDGSLLQIHRLLVLLHNLYENH